MAEQTEEEVKLAADAVAAEEAKAAEAVKPVEAAAAPLDLDAAPAEVVVGTTGNETVDGVGKLLASKQLANADNIIGEFAKTGEISLENKAAIVDALGDTVGAMAINTLTTEATKIATENSKARTGVLNYANEVFGGDDANTTWTQIQEYVKTPEAGFSADQRATMTSMLAKGGFQAQLVIDNIAKVYAGDSNITVPADLLAGDTLATSAAFTPISALDYAGEVSTAVAKHGYDSPQVKSLQARREQSRNQGYA